MNRAKERPRQTRSMSQESHVSTLLTSMKTEVQATVLAPFQARVERRRDPRDYQQETDNSLTTATPSTNSAICTVAWQSSMPFAALDHPGVRLRRFLRGIELPLVQAVLAGIEQRSADVMVEPRANRPAERTSDQDWRTCRRHAETPCLSSETW